MAIYGRRALLFAACLVSAAVVWTQQADAGVSCTFEAEPESFQFRGGEITVIGSFTELPPNHDFRVVMATGFGIFGPEGQALEPVGTTNGAGQFDHTVTVPPDHPTGDFQLAVTASESNPFPAFPTIHVCWIPYSVTTLFIGPIVTIATTTTTTLGIATPTTSPPATTTTTVPDTTTTVAKTTTTGAETATTTTVAPTSTTVEDSEALVAGEQTGGAPGWMIVLLILMAVALAGIGGYALARRRSGSA